MQVQAKHLARGAERHAMGESQGTLFQPDFNRSIQVEARRQRLSTEAGALLLRELMERMGWAALMGEHLNDGRDSRRVTHPWVELLRTTVLLQAQGWSDQDDVTGLRDDPVLALAVSGRRGQRPVRPAQGREPEGLCSQPTLSRVYATLSTPANREALGELLRATAERRAGPRGSRRLREVTIDLDSLPLWIGNPNAVLWIGWIGNPNAVLWIGNPNAVFASAEAQGSGAERNQGGGWIGSNTPAAWRQGTGAMAG
jgi:hypothetical protein